VILATLIRQMTEAGAPPEAIAIAVAAIEGVRAEINAIQEADEARLAASRKYERERKAKWRLSQGHDGDNGPGDMTGLSRDTPPKKEVSPATPPLLEKTPPQLTVADATVVDELVDVGRVAFEKVKKDTEALRSFGEQWNALAAAFKFPAIEEIKTGSTRERHALARLREMGPDGVQGLMTRIRGSPYLRGEVNGFRVTFDWIINASNFQKIMEGNYEVRKVASFGRHGQPARVL
jgi:hypothetical protein